MRRRWKWNIPADRGELFADALMASTVWMVVWLVVWAMVMMAVGITKAGGLFLLEKILVGVMFAPVTLVVSIGGLRVLLTGCRWLWDRRPRREWESVEDIREHYTERPGSRR